jgi:hypothetical protein
MNWWNSADQVEEREAKERKRKEKKIEDKGRFVVFDVLKLLTWM